MRRFTLGLALALAGGSLRADVTLPASPPPQVDPAFAVVKRGERTTISLRAHYGGSRMLTFRINQPPAHGRLLDLRLLDDRRAEIVYENDGAEDVASDSFTYVVKAGDLSSSPAVVRISIEEPPAVLRAPAEIDFGEVVAGESSSRSLTIANPGGGILGGTISVSGPWETAATEYQVKAGTSRELALRFRPDEGRRYTGLARLIGTNGAEANVKLTGRGTLAVAVEPASLRTDPISMRGTFRLTNRTAKSLPLQFATSHRIHPIDQVLLAPEETKEIEITPQRAKIPFHDRITVLGPGFRVPLQVEAEAPSAPPVSAASPSASPISPRATITASPAAFPPAARSVALTTPAPSPDRWLAAVKARRLSPATWELRWRQPQEAVAHYQIEERILSLGDGGQLQTSWRPLRASVAAASGGAITARVDGLDPKQLHLLRVRALGAEKTLRWISPLLSLPPVAQTGNGKGLALFLLLAILAFLFVLRWRRGRG
jgi:hypothetical protein